MWEFELVTIEKAPPPVAEAQGSWYRYTIANRITSVSGQRRGSKAEVTQFVNYTIQRLNTRHLGVRGRESFSL